MTAPTGTFTAFSQKGIREDLTDMIWKISPVDTPFISMIPHVEATNVLHEWQTISLTAAAQNAAIEGDDAPQDSGRATTRLTNRTQISTKDARVSGTGRAVNTAGREDELDYQIMLAGQELKRDMETSILLNNAKVTGDATTPREAAGLPTWIATNVDFGDGGSASSGDGSDTLTQGTEREFQESDFKTVIRSIFDEGGNPDTLMVGSFNRQKVSGFSGGNTSMQRAEDKTLHATFDIYESDFFQLRVVPNRFQRAREAYLLQREMLAMPFLTGRNMVTFDIAKTGDSDARQILAEWTLEVRNEAAHGMVADLTTS